MQLRSVTAKDALRLQKEQGYTILDVRLESDFEEVKKQFAYPSSAFFELLVATPHSAHGEQRELCGHHSLGTAAAGSIVMNRSCLTKLSVLSSNSGVCLLHSLFCRPTQKEQSTCRSTG